MLVLAMQFSKGYFGQDEPDQERNKALANGEGFEGAPLQNGTEDGTIFESSFAGREYRPTTSEPTSRTQLAHASTWESVSTVD